MNLWLPFFRRARPRRVVLVMTVRDEADILAANLDFHFAHGIDFAVIADNGSTDGTRDLLAAGQRAGRLAWEDEPDPAYHQHAWMTRLARRAREEFGADWIVCSDADEFWQTDAGDLKDFIARQAAPILRCARRNEVRVRPDADGADAGAFLAQRYAPVLRPRHWTQPSAERSARELSDPAVPGIVFHAEAPKVLARADLVAAVRQGNHDVDTTRWAWRSAPAGLVIRHFPIRTGAQFAAKVRAGGAAYTRTDFPANVGWHWRHWHACAERGELAAAFARETLGDTAPPGVVVGPARTAAAALGLGRGTSG